MTTIATPSVSAAVLAGSTDDVLDAMLQRLAADIDNPATPAYVRARLAGSLLALVREQSRRAEATGGKAAIPEDELAALRRKAGRA